MPQLNVSLASPQACCNDMPYAKKPAFEQFRASQIAHGKPLAEKDVVPIQAAIVAHLDTIQELLVQKVRRQGHKETLVEISASWVGLDGDPKAAIAILRRFWPGRLFADVEEMYHVDRSEETVLLTFAVQYPSDHYLTGRLLVTF